MSVWNDVKLREWAESGGVTPFESDSIKKRHPLLSGASIDLRISNMVATLAGNHDKPILRYGDKEHMSRLWQEPREFTSFHLYPGQAVLLSTIEYVTMPDNAAGTVLSKSTAGRCLIEHAHSGYVDCSFRGTLTLELINFANVIWDLRPGDRLVQLIMTSMTDAAETGYDKTGRYQGQTMPTAPKGWEVESYHCG